MCLLGPTAWYSLLSCMMVARRARRTALSSGATLGSGSMRASSRRQTTGPHAHEVPAKKFIRYQLSSNLERGVILQPTARNMRRGRPSTRAPVLSTSAAARVVGSIQPFWVYCCSQPLN